MSSGRWGIEPRVLVAGASGFAGALAAELVWHHPGLELGAVTSRSTPGSRLDDLYPRYRVAARARPSSTSTRRRGVDAAIVAYPHGAVRAGRRRRCASSGLPVVDLSADFRLRDPTSTSSWYGAHGAPGAARRRRLRPAPSSTATQIARGASWSPTPAATRPRRVLALAPLAERGLIDDVVIDAKSGRLRRRARRRRHDSASSTMTENVVALQASAATATRPRSTRSWPRSARRRRRSPSCRTCCRSTRASCVSCYVDARPSRSRAGELADALRGRATPTSRSSRSSTRRPACATCATPTSAAIHVAVDARTGRVLVFGAIDNLWKGAAGQAVQNLNLMLGLDETGRAAGERATRSLLAPRWVDAARPGVERARPDGSARRASAPAGVACGLKAPAAPTSACVVCDAPRRRARRCCSPGTPPPRRRSGSAASAATPDAIRAVVVNSRQRQRRHRRAGLRRRRRDAGALRRRARRRRRRRSPSPRPA